LPALGAPAIALLLGMAARLRWQPGPGAARLVSFASRVVLQTAIVLLGATFSLGRVAHTGRSSLPLMLTTLALALLAAALLIRLLRVPDRVGTLVGVGTAICGASAIAAVAPVVEAAQAEIAYSISAIFVFNVVAVVLYPAVGHLLELGQHTFGLWAGTAVNDTSSVVAAAYAYGTAAGTTAVVTKLARTTMIIPLVVGLSIGRYLGAERARRPPLRRLVPLFLVWFLVASALNSTGLIGAGTVHDLDRLAKVLIAVALAGVGLSTHPDELRRAGPRPLLLAFLLWLVVATSGLALQRVV
jgi:uncharacterized integral membrane protein (TIGR00698 family)